MLDGTQELSTLKSLSINASIITKEYLGLFWNKKVLKVRDLAIELVSS